MSGHSHFAGIKHRKGINDAKRANVFAKLAKPIVIAARDGGGNPDNNFKLRLAIDKAREFNMPKENIERAIKRGTGELKDGAEIQEIIYEAYGPGQVAMLIKAATDNKNRTLGEIKTILTKTGGKLVPSGSAKFLFKQTGLSFVPLQKVSISQDDKINYEKLLERLDEQEDVQEILDNL